MKKLSYLAILVIAVLATSCLGSNSSSFEYTRSLQSSSNFTVVSDGTGDETVIATGGVYELRILPDEGKLSVSVSGLQLSPNSGSYSFTIQDAPFKYDETGALVVSVTDHLDASGQGLAINKFELRYLERYMDGTTAIPAWSISFIVNGRMNVRAIQKTTVLFGLSEVTVAQSGTTYRQNTSYYSLRFVPDGATSNQIKANLYLFDAKFADKMPQMNLGILDIPTTVGVNSFSMHVADLPIYTVNGNDKTEEPDFRISDFNGMGGYGIAADNIHFDFTVGGRFETLFSLGCKIPTEEIND